MICSRPTRRCRATMLLGVLAAGAALLGRAGAGEALWKEVSGMSLPIPPPEHPRLYLRPAHVPDLRTRLRHPVLQPAVARLEGMARKNPAFRVEWEALQILASGDREAGRATLAATLEFLRAMELPDRNDACRVTGRAMVTGALVYDWLYPLLTAAEKEAFVNELVRLAKTQECGYPPTRQGSVTGHASEAQIMRDMLSAGIAIYDEFPEMYDLAAGRFFREHLPVRNWLYAGHAYHQGDSYGPYRFSWDTFPLWIFDRLGAGNVYNPEQRHVPLFYLYTTRPDGQRLRAGDTFAHSAGRGRPWGVGIGALLVASYYGDGLALGEHLRQGGVSDNEAIFELLWRDPDLEPLPRAGLPLSRHFGGPFGWTVARTGWDEQAVIAEMKVNVSNFTNHQHLDAGAFQLYHKGALAIDSGLYSGSSGAYGSPHCRNYYWRTVAHNSLLIHDPAETFGRDGSYGNDGGQRLPNQRSEPRNLEILVDPANGYGTGAVLAQGCGPDPVTPAYTLLTGDLTAAYSNKVRQVVRSFVFLNLGNATVPAALIVFDRVVASQPSFRKTWLLHTLEEPRVNGTRATVDRTEAGGQGRLRLDVLLPTPDNADLGTVGGPGREFWVGDRNYPNDVPPERLAASSMEPGAWRLELSPRQAAHEDLFLTAMQVMDRQTGQPFQVERQDADTHTGCCLRGATADWLVLFARDGNRLRRDLRISVSGPGRTRVLVTGLAPGTWQARGPGATALDLAVTAEAGVAWFEAEAGDWALTPP